MRKPFICFCGDEEKCLEVMNSCKDKIKAVIITRKNCSRLLDTPRRHPSLICLIFKKDAHANDELYRKIYAYSALSRCPLHVIGSRRNLETISKIASRAVVQRSNLNLMLEKIQEICDYAAENPNNELNMLKARFETVVVLSDKAYTLSLCESKVSKSLVKPRVITASSLCKDKEYELIQKEQLSGIVTDKPLSTNSLELFKRVSKTEAPAILLDRNEKYGRKVAIRHISSKDESDKITELIDEYSQKRSKLIFIRTNK